MAGEDKALENAGLKVGDAVFLPVAQAAGRPYILVDNTALFPSDADAVEVVFVRSEMTLIGQEAIVEATVEGGFQLKTGPFRGQSGPSETGRARLPKQVALDLATALLQFYAQRGLSEDDLQQLLVGRELIKPVRKNARRKR
jgi:hypothetical protein